MKQLRKLQLKDAHVLSNLEMKQIEGGVSAEEYCCTLIGLINGPSSEGWSSGAWEGAYYGMGICINLNVFPLNC